MTGWKIDLRWHDGRLTDRTVTDDAAMAEAAYRALLRRDDLGGQPVAARMVSPITRRSIYYSRFDEAPGITVRIHPDAPLDLMADRDMTAEAVAWRPAAMHDWETDPRPLADCLKEWQAALNGGLSYGSRPVGQEALRIESAETYAGLLKGRATPYERTIRLAMTLIDRERRA